MKFKSISQVLGNTSNQVETYSGHHWKINSGRLIDNFLGFKIENQWNWSILIRDHFNLKSVYEFLQWFLPPTYSPNDFDDYRWEINYKRLWNYFRTKSHKNTLSQTEVKYWEILRYCGKIGEIMPIFFRLLNFRAQENHSIQLNRITPSRTDLLCHRYFCHHFFSPTYLTWYVTNKDVAIFLFGQ